MVAEIEISKEEFSTWKENKVTEAIMNGLREIQGDLKEYLANGGTLSKDSTVTTEFLVGRIQGINDFLNVEYEEPKPDYGH